MASCHANSLLRSMSACGPRGDATSRFRLLLQSLCSAVRKKKKQGNENWHKTLCDFSFFFFVAVVVVAAVCLSCRKLTKESSVIWLWPLLYRAVTIYRRIDIIAALRRFWRYHDIFCRCDIGDIPSVHQSRWSEFQASSFFECFGSFHGCWRHVRITGRSWKAATVASVAEIGEEFERAEATEGEKSVTWLHFGLRLGEANLVNNNEVECWHCGATVKQSGNTTNLAGHGEVVRRHGDWTANKVMYCEASFAGRCLNSGCAAQEATSKGYGPLSSMAAFHGNTYKVNCWWALVGNRKPHYRPRLEIGL